MLLTKIFHNNTSLTIFIISIKQTGNMDMFISGFNFLSLSKMKLHYHLSSISKKWVALWLHDEIFSASRFFFGFLSIVWKFQSRVKLCFYTCSCFFFLIRDDKPVKVSILWSRPSKQATLQPHYSKVLTPYNQLTTLKWRWSHNVKIKNTLLQYFLKIW